MSKKLKSSSSKTRAPVEPTDGRQLKGDKRWVREPRLPLADFYAPAPATPEGIIELHGRRIHSLRRWLLASSERASTLVIHRNACAITKSSNGEDPDCSCTPTYLVTGAQA